MYAIRSYYGKVSQEAYEYFSGHLLEGIQAAGAIDGVLLHLHGAMVTDEVDDGETTMIGALFFSFACKICCIETG